ncbi:MAG: exodeoxyribonuclease VII small subunit [Candidatus Chaera renei]|uniref:Exodeoxyribonuclease VII small subunit n=1 Tax=Candidatus Chaera renei TaxID=2506947 RepID=A0A4Q0AJQ9_9BACT|nr:MAG: exodeoxyribonuclease VII small subunit [Candidatus Chaera renei]
MTDNAKSAQPKSLKQLMEELDGLVAWFEREDIDLEEALAKFQAGVELAAQIKKRLGRLENKIVLLKQKFEEQEP